jgi:hypothetical protein
MWDLYNLAKTWSCRPSQLLDIENSWDAFRIDDAVAVFGGAIELQLSNIDGKNMREIQKKQELALRRILAGRDSQKYRDPAV